MRLLKPHQRDLGGFSVRRLLPGFPDKMIGPFVFFDHMGPVRFAPGSGVDVRPHPHIGLATVTYLFEGAIVHRDSLGTVQRIEAGDVNWMTAGSGIVHSERSPAAERAAGSQLHGLQTWVALPKAHEQTDPGFSHHAQATLPLLAEPGVEMRLIAGTFRGQQSPVPVYSDTLYVAAEMQAGSRLTLEAEHEERAVYVVAGDITVDDMTAPLQHMAVLPQGKSVEIRAADRATLMLLGGARLDGDRHVWWNFVASSRELLEIAKQRWREQRFAPVPGETEFIPLPDK
jgi:redox-sensitive bicupin YhaK (pirin superfamily)